MHELAAVEAGVEITNVQLFPRTTSISVTRCPSCGGLRSVSERRARESGGRCMDCRKGKVIRIEEFYDFWFSSFSQEEIEDMARAMWG